MKINVHRTIMLFLILYGCEVWFLRDEHILRKTFWPQRDGVTGDWMK